MGYSSVQALDVTLIGYPDDTPASVITHWKFNGTTTDEKAALAITGLPSHYIRMNGLVGGNTNKCAVNSQATMTAPSAGVVKFFGALTVSCWLYRGSNTGATASILGMRLPGGGSAFNFPWAFDVTSAGNLRLYHQSGTKIGNEVLSTLAYPVGEWHHVAATRNSAGTTSTLYIDGVQDTQATGLNPPSGGSSQNTLVFMSNGAGTALIGEIAGAMIQNVELTPTQVLSLYQSSLVNL